MELLGYARHADPVLRGHVATLAGGVVHGILSSPACQHHDGIGMYFVRGCFATGKSLDDTRCLFTGAGLKELCGLLVSQLHDDASQVQKMACSGLGICLPDLLAAGYQVCAQITRPVPFASITLNGDMLRGLILCAVGRVQDTTYMDEALTVLDQLLSLIKVLDVESPAGHGLPGHCILCLGHVCSKVGNSCAWACRKPTLAHCCRRSVIGSWRLKPWKSLATLTGCMCRQLAVQVCLPIVESKIHRIKAHVPTLPTALSSQACRPC